MNSDDDLLALQWADVARVAGADEEMIIAALLHNIGHITPPETEVGELNHERRGSNCFGSWGSANGFASWWKVMSRRSGI